jgi:hypothetical protein
MRASREYRQDHLINTLDTEPYLGSLRVIINNSIDADPQTGIFPQEHSVIDLTPNMELPKQSATYGVERYKKNVSGEEVYPLSLIVITVGEAQTAMFKGKLTLDQLERMQAALVKNRYGGLEPTDNDAPAVDYPLHNDPCEPEARLVCAEDDNQPSHTPPNSLKIETADYKLVCRMTAATASHNKPGYDPHAAGFYTVFCTNGITKEVIALLDKMEDYQNREDGELYADES